MAWTVGRANPLVVYPSPNVYEPRFTSALGAGLNNWHGSGAASLVSGEGQTGTNALRLNPAAATVYADQYSALTGRFKSYTLENATGAMSIYFRAKAKSCTPNAWLELYAQYATAAFTPSGSAIYEYFPIGSSTTVGTTGEIIPIDNTWRLYRNVAQLPDMPSNAAYIYILIGRIGASETFDAYIDDVQFGHALDGQDLNGLSNYGAMAVHPFKYGSTAAGTFGANVAGKYSARRFHSGYKSGTLSFTPFTETNRATWNKFITYAADGQPFSVNYAQNDGTRDYFSKAVLSMDSDGLEQVTATPNWRGSIDWREVP